MATTPWYRPAWSAPAGVQSAMTTREGGASLPPFCGFNLGDHVGDDPATVARHRAQLTQALGVRAIYLHQVHGTEVVRLDDRTSVAGPLTADAAITTVPGLACTIMVADCLPVLLAHRQGRGVGAAHAGWRGLAGGVVERTVASLADAADARPSDLVAWLGPCIGPRRFEVGEEVRAAFLRGQPGADTHFKPGERPGKWWADLQGLARDRLSQCGVTEISAEPACTVEDASRFFSYRRDGRTGRMAALVWLG
ncbi:peptidoglycan editing factor PgeF [Caldimonas caldifontis]|uniref:Purine nucleoside phosphorylase n=2 Tax=Caldimonas caldifontis TaxID=1452508 RepID=A0A2S5SUV9_9BURK|nr:peptidoglycan editing factor PgeF [Caldimonas caldifontis]